MVSILLIELVELHFDEFMMFQRVNQGSEEWRAQTFFAHLQRGFEPLGLGLEVSNLRIVEWSHGVKMSRIAVR